MNTIDYDGMLNAYNLRLKFAKALHPEDAEGIKELKETKQAFITMYNTIYK